MTLAGHKQLEKEWHDRRATYDQSLVDLLSVGGTDDHDSLYGRAVANDYGLGDALTLALEAHHFGLAYPQQRSSLGSIGRMLADWRHRRWLERALDMWEAQVEAWCIDNKISWAA